MKPSRCGRCQSRWVLPWAQYRHVPSTSHLLVSAPTREVQRLDASCDWSAVGATPKERLEMLTARLHSDWQRDPQLTEAVTRAWVFADTTAASAINQAADVIERIALKESQPKLS